MEIKITKVTDEKLMRMACNKTFRGNSKQTLLSMYKSEHSPCRTQMFWIDLNDIPLFVSTHLIRHHVGSQPFALTMRKDRGSDSFGDSLSDIVDDLQESIDVDDKLNYTDKNRLIDEIDALYTRFDRLTPTNLGLFLNAQSLIDMSKLRLCHKASKETRNVMELIKYKMLDVDPSLSKMMVPKCIYRNGICGEPKCCGFNMTEEFKEKLNLYLENFNK